MKTPRSNYGRIENSGCGGFLCPPDHPEHDYSVVSSYGNPFSMSLSYASESDWLNSKTKQAARGMLKTWENSKLSIFDPEVQNWIHNVLGYFHDCYLPVDAVGNIISENASELIIDKDRDPMAIPSLHAGVNLIRKYYPNYTPRNIDFILAYWGKR